MGAEVEAWCVHLICGSLVVDPGLPRRGTLICEPRVQYQGACAGPADTVKGEIWEKKTFYLKKRIGEITS